ncbi:MAG: hypothetical protein CK424_06150 [Legionella sp.]|nr:MAG: hypothetical protein CK424_06150 [Legionella sp.]
MFSKVVATEQPKLLSPLIQAINNEDVAAVLRILDKLKHDYIHNDSSHNAQITIERFNGMKHLIQYSDANEKTLYLLRMFLDYEKDALLGISFLRGWSETLCEPALFVAIKYDKKEFYLNILKHPNATLNFTRFGYTPLSYAAFYDKHTMFNEILTDPRMDPWLPDNIRSLLCREQEETHTDAIQNNQIYRNEFIRFFACRTCNNPEKTRQLFRNAPDILSLFANHQKLLSDFILKDSLPSLESSYEDKRDYFEMLVRISDSEGQDPSTQDPFYMVFAEAKKQAATPSIFIFNFFGNTEHTGSEVLDKIKARVEMSSSQKLLK